MSFDNVKWRPMHYSMGVEIGSDFTDKPEGDPLRWQHENVGFWSQGEAKLLRQIASQFDGHWLDIGAHTGWTAAHIAKWGHTHVTSIEPMFMDYLFYERFVENLQDEISQALVMPFPGTSDLFFNQWGDDPARKFAGACIDGDHDKPHPLRDAVHCLDRLEDRGVIVLHDFRGPGPWDAGEYLAEQGMQYKVYGSVHMVGVFWRGDFTPPAEIAEGKTHADWILHYGLPNWAK
jgi:hypothetical protein